MSGHFTQEKIQKVKKHVKTMFNTLFIRELQIKTTTNTTIHPLQSLKLKALTIKCWHGYGATGTLICCWRESKITQPL